MGRAKLGGGTRHKLCNEAVPRMQFRMLAQSRFRGPSPRYPLPKRKKGKKEWNYNLLQITNKQTIHNKGYFTACQPRPHSGCWLEPVITGREFSSAANASSILRARSASRRTSHSSSRLTKLIGRSLTAVVLRALTPLARRSCSYSRACTRRLLRRKPASSSVLPRVLPYAGGGGGAISASSTSPVPAAPDASAAAYVGNGGRCQGATGIEALAECPPRCREVGSISPGCLEAKRSARTRKMRRSIRTICARAKTAKAT